MDYLKQYKSFINSYYLSEGVRITIGVTLPAIIFNYFNNLSVGILVSLGALCASMPDNAGPPLHRRNAMMVCNLVVFLAALVTGIASNNAIVLGIVISISCFAFAMMGVYGSRATSIGLAGLLVMVLSIDKPSHGWEFLLNPLYILAGGIWYMVLSLSLNSFRPYKLAQQALGECIQTTADYLRLKASFYEKKDDFSDNYSQLLDKQIEVHHKQDLVRELLFKSRDIVRESTATGRILVMAFLDIIDLFEKIMTSHQDYTSLHASFDSTELLKQYRQTILAMAKELDEVGIAVKSTRAYEQNDELPVQVMQLRNYFIEFRDKHRNAENLEGFISMRHILDSIEDIAYRIYTLEGYTTYDKKISRQGIEQIDYEKFIAHQDIQPGLLKENLSLSSNIFRHSLRLSIATLTGFIVSRFFSFGHSYWILLTIIVIIKPAYSLTKRRNYERLLGTITGAFIGIVALYLIKDKTILFAIMIFFMIGSYSFMRTHYLVFVILMTPYILLLFHLLNPDNFQMVIADRIIDTLIGSLIAFVANIVLLPAWEHEQITEYLEKMIGDTLRYFEDATAPFLNKPVSTTLYKLSRKNAFVSLANLTDAFNRMLSEPKSKQKNIREMHQFVVSSHLLTSHIATLSYYAPSFVDKKNLYQLSGAINAIKKKLINAEALFLSSQEKKVIDEEAWRHFNNQVNEVTERRKKELQAGILESDTKKELSVLKPIADQFNFIMNNASSLERLSTSLKKAL
ncbi:MAG: FUSC family protein [Bacteroidetes bacterium]|nr:FUSC family protein [Bacteroidota bacterium]